MPDEPKKKRKHRKHTINDFYHGNKLHKEKYGFIEIDNPEYYKKNNGYFAVPEFLMRKPTPEERKEIIVNYIQSLSASANISIYLPLCAMI